MSEHRPGLALVPPDGGGSVPVRSALAGSVERWVRYEPLVRSGDDAEAIHQARVALRRLRSDLRSFASVLEVPDDAALLASIRSLGNALGAVRDLDVLIGDLEADGATLPEAVRPAAETIVGRFRADRASAQHALLRELRTKRYAVLLDRLVTIAEAPPFVKGGPLTPDPAAVMGPAWRRLVRWVEGAGSEASDPQLHAIRIRAKRVRYAAEALEPFVGKRAASFARSAAALQDVLGRHQDAVVAIDRLAEVTRDAEPPAAFAAGWLAASRATARATARAEWRPAWHDLSRKKRRFW